MAEFSRPDWVFNGLHLGLHIPYSRNFSSSLVLIVSLDLSSSVPRLSGFRYHRCLSLSSQFPYFPYSSKFLGLVDQAFELSSRASRVMARLPHSSLHATVFA